MQGPVSSAGRRAEACIALKPPPPQTERATNQRLSRPTASTNQIRRNEGKGTRHISNRENPDLLELPAKAPE